MQNTQTTRPSSILLSALICACALLITACASSVGMGKKNTAFATTDITNSSPTAVSNAIAAVFKEEGFATLSQTSKGFRFQKDGGESSKAIYGSWLSGGVMIEPVVKIEDLGNGNFTVNCDVYMREYKDNQRMANDPWKLRKNGKKAYNALLKDVKQRAEGR